MYTRYEAELINFKLDQYFKTAIRRATIPNDEKLLLQLTEDLMSLERLSIYGGPPLLEILNELKELHRVGLRTPQGGWKDHITKLIALRIRFSKKIESGIAIPHTVPMSTGRHSPENISELSHLITDPPRPEIAAGAQTPAAGLEISARESGLAGPALAFEKRYITASAPTKVTRDTKFSIIACIDITVGWGGSSAPLADVAIPLSGMIVIIETIVEGGLELLGLASQQVRIFPGEKSSNIEISLQATDFGPSNIVLRTRTDQAYLGDLHINIEVASDGAPDTQNLKSGIAVTAPVARRATLAISYTRPDRKYKFTLFKGTADVHEAELMLDENLETFVPKLMAQANGLARGIAGYESNEAEAALSGIGSEMWDRLLPEKIKAVLTRCWDSIDHLSIVSNDDMLPWELLFAYTPGGPDMGFISDKWLITRWRFGEGAEVNIGTGPSVYVIPSAAPQAAYEEIDTLRKKFPSDAIWKTVDELNKGISRPGMGLLHIAAHNTVCYGEAATSYISLDKPFSQSMLASHLDGVLTHRPLVFINACASAASTVQWLGSTSWAARFLKAGAGVFIGSNWEVRDETALKFAEEFYEQARLKQPLGLAFQRARHKCAGPGDPTRFAYSFFGHPDSVLQAQGADT